MAEDQSELKIIIGLALQEHLIKEYQVEHESKFVNSIEHEIAKIRRDIGAEIVAWLEKIGLVKEQIIKNVPHTVFINTQVIDLIAGASFYKPPISLEDISTVYTTSTGKLELNLDLNQDPIPNKKNVHIFAKEKLLSSLQSSGKMQHAINIAEFQAFLTLLKQALLYTNATVNINAEETITILLSLYDIDFSLYLKNI